MKRHCRWFSEDTGRCMHKKNSPSAFPCWCGYKAVCGWEMHGKDMVECELYFGIKEVTK